MKMDRFKYQSFHIILISPKFSSDGQQKQTTICNGGSRTQKRVPPYIGVYNVAGSVFHVPKE
jgi:hypothetical protein